jgi:membrane protease YdiL (CAAX protease family)
MALRTVGGSREIAAFVLLAYGVSWTAWGVASLLDGPAAFAVDAVATLGPLLAALVVVARRGERVRTWLAVRLDPRTGWRWSLLALVLPVVGVLVAGGTHALLFGGRVTPGAIPSPLSYPLYLGLVVLFFGGLEEPGWRGFALPRLQGRYGPLAASLVVGVVWAGWHAPLFVLPGTIQGSLPPLVYVAQLLAMSVVLTWLTNAAGGSVVPAVLLHAGGNAVVNFYPVGGAAGGTTLLGFGLLTGTVVLLAVALVVRYGPSLGVDGETTGVAAPVARDPVG